MCLGILARYAALLTKPCRLHVCTPSDWHGYHRVARFCVEKPCFRQGQPLHTQRHEHIDVRRTPDKLLPGVFVNTVVVCTCLLQLVIVSMIIAGVGTQ